MNIFDQPKIDTHCHILDPVGFPYAPDVFYRPQGGETGSVDYFKQVMDVYGVKHALLVGPNSGYGLDNRCLLDAIAHGEGRFKGIAVVQNNISFEELKRLQGQGIVGVAFNVALYGLEYYADIEPLLNKLKQLNMWAQFQVEGDLLPLIVPLIQKTQIRVLIDHCGRPILSNGIQQPGFESLLELGRSKQAIVKISGFAKFSEGYPFADAHAYIDALVEAFGIENCIWASDWPHLRSPYRLDYGPLIRWVENKFTPSEQHQLFWETPKRLFDFV